MYNFFFLIFFYLLYYYIITLLSCRPASRLINKALIFISVWFVPVGIYILTIMFLREILVTFWTFFKKCLTLEALSGGGGGVGFKFLLLDRLSKTLAQLFLIC